MLLLLRILKLPHLRVLLQEKFLDPLIFYTIQEKVFTAPYVIHKVINILLKKINRSLLVNLSVQKWWKRLSITIYLLITILWEYREYMPHWFSSAICLETMILLDTFLIKWKSTDTRNFLWILQAVLVMLKNQMDFHNAKNFVSVFIQLCSMKTWRDILVITLLITLEWKKKAKDYKKFLMIHK